MPHNIESKLFIKHVVWISSCIAVMFAVLWSVFVLKKAAVRGLELGQFRVVPQVPGLINLLDNLQDGFLSVVYSSDHKA